jgi:hypothetical protein
MRWRRGSGTLFLGPRGEARGPWRGSLGSLRGDQQPDKPLHRADGLVPCVEDLH